MASTYPYNAERSRASPSSRAPVTNIHTTPYDRYDSSARYMPLSTGYQAPVGNMTATYRGRESSAIPFLQTTRGAGGLTAEYRPSERHRDGYSSRERSSSRFLASGAVQGHPYTSSHSYELSQERYGDRYMDGSAPSERENRSWYRGQYRGC